MRIDDHAVDRYITRVLEVNLHVASNTERETYRDLLLEAALNPEYIYDEKAHYMLPNGRTYPVIHIRDDVAVPVDKETQIVPTAYKAETFLRKIDGKQSA